ncbi:hypothetical protein MMC30_005406 [Trapelia coarctata]|nr:hypothetical protein [Trapelia coarctata]
MPLQLKDRCISYLEPFMFFAYGFYYWTLTILAALLTLDAHALLSFSTLADRAFAKLWLKFSPIFFDHDNETILPTLLALCTGTILELGPGTGSQLPRYRLAQVTKIYGVEPVSALHPALRASIKANRLNDVYEVVGCGIEDVDGLRSVGVVEGSVDTIVSVQVLCSVDAGDVEKVVERLYGLLRVGGKLVVYEHVGSGDWGSWGVQSVFLSLAYTPSFLSAPFSTPLRSLSPSSLLISWQLPPFLLFSSSHILFSPGLVNTGMANEGTWRLELYTLSRLWPLVMGNCHLDRPTQEILERAGPWAKNELRNDQASMRASLFPRVVGVLTK